LASRLALSTTIPRRKVGRRGEKVRFGREVMDNELAQVELTSIQPKGDEITVIYKLRQVNGQWRAYDAIVENISIINNYRSQFDRVISSSSYEELVKRLREKNS
jgi:phospholipid transport system substrate-binding protein